MLWKRKSKPANTSPVPECDLIKVNAEQLEKIKQALDELNKELIMKNEEKLSIARAIH